jgi:hypothetical protein
MKVPQMNETLDRLLAADAAPAFTVDNENGTSPFLIVADHAASTCQSGLDGLAYPMPNAIDTHKTLRTTPRRWRKRDRAALGNG